MEENQIYLIGNAHLDPVWLWQWQEGFAEIKATFRSALDRMKEFDDFKFTSACSAYYMWIEQSDREMFREIQKRVREGRWNITGGFFIQPDCNLPSGESFARHALISQSYFLEKFGLIAHTGYNVDSFGHNANLPQILKNSGMDSYVFMRPGPHEKELPSNLFDWESLDGSRVRAYRIPYLYSIVLERFECLKKIEAMAESMPQMAFYGIGNHGGGATVELLDTMHRELSDRYIYSTPEEYFDNVRDMEVPVVCDDLQFHATGCYSAMSEIKANNRLCENMLYQTEAYSILSNRLMDTVYPADELNLAWKNVLFNQFHDILGGCSIKEAYTDARYLHNEALSVASRNCNFALQQISWNIDTLQGKELRSYKISTPPVPSWRSGETIGTPIVVFNPLVFEQEALVTVRDTASKMTDDNNDEILFQMVRDSKTNGNDKFATAFLAKVPAMGYSVYRMYFQNQKTEFTSSLKASDTFMENDSLYVAFENGELSVLLDKTTGKNLLSGASYTVLMDETDCDTWAHGIREFKKCVAVCRKGSSKLVETGPVRVMIQCEQVFENTHIIRFYSLELGQRSISVRTKIDFREKHRMLKFCIPVNVENPDHAEAFHDIPFGYIQKEADGTEQPCGDWVALKDAHAGISVATTSKYSYDADKNVLSLTVLRGAVFADHYGNRDEFCEYMDQGEHEFTYTIAPFASLSDSKKQAQILNNKPTAIVETFHSGKLKTCYAGISVSSDHIVVTAIKKQESSNAIVVRCYEAEGMDTDTEIMVFGRKIAAKFRHHEMKTFLVSDNGVEETDFLENGPCNA